MPPRKNYDGPGELPPGGGEWTPGQQTPAFVPNAPVALPMSLALKVGSKVTFDSTPLPVFLSVNDTGFGDPAEKGKGFGN